MIRSYQALQYNWFPRGKQRKVPTHGKHEGAKLFGAINYETGQVHHREEEKADTIRLHVSQFMNRINNQPMETIDRLLVRL
ncbi:hypothetical protein [Paenibacillus sp. URB8-2]|uniref:hypothetical protein n=1 Tax=Paenibacillus sp. URB8-2 TaxID=2741301 RepID=UPI003FA749BC